MTLTMYPPDAFTVGNTSTQVLPAVDVSQASEWLIDTVYALNAVVFNEDATGAEKYYWATVAGTSAGSGGPVHNEGAVADNTVTWKRLHLRREQLILQNDSDEDMYVAFGPNAAVLNTGVRIGKNGGSFNAVNQMGTTPQGEVNLICATGGKNLLIQEF